MEAVEPTAVFTPFQLNVPVTLGAPPSGSVTLSSTLPDFAVSSLVVTDSLASSRSFTGRMSMVRVETLVSIPSVTV